MLKLASNKLNSTILDSFISAKHLGQSDKFNANIIKRKNLKNDLELETKQIIADNLQNNSSEENDDEESESHQRINIFEVTNYQNKKIKLQSDLPQKQISIVDADLEKTQKIISDEIKPDFGLNPFKDKVKIIERDEDIELQEKLEQLKEDNNIEIRDEELDPFIGEMNSKYNYSIERIEKIEEERKKLPIFMRESDIIEAINNNLITIICGETGSG